MPSANPLRVASWPGRSFDGNAFMTEFIGALERARVMVRDEENPVPIFAQADEALIAHWPEKALWGARDPRTRWRMAWRLLRAVASRPAGVRLIWIAHNLTRHDAGFVDRMLWRAYLRAFSRAVDGVVTLSPGTLPVVLAHLPALRRKPSLAIWHPPYRDQIIDEARRRDLRAARGFDDDVRVIGYCGMLRPYKGVETLIDAFRAAPEPSWRLLIAGKPSDEVYGAALRARAGDDPRIQLAPGALSDVAFRDTLGVCDLVAAPFRRYLHSGSLVHALSAARPVLTPDTPFARSLRDALPPGWVTLHDGMLSATHMRAALAAAPSPAADGGGADLSALDPDRSAAAMAAFVHRLARPENLETAR